jgi:hypothetical protein
MIISIDVEKGFDKILNHFIIRALKKREIEQYLNMIKCMYIKQIVHIKPKSFPLTGEIRQECPLSPLLCNVTHAVFVRAIREIKKK